MEGDIGESTESGSGGSSSSSSKRQKLPGPPPEYSLEALEESELLSQGAEGKVYTCRYLSREAVIKERQSKAYRVAALDAKINKQRLLQEARCMVKCRRAGVLTPSIYMVDQQNFRIYMERIQGSTVKALLRAQQAQAVADQPCYSAQCLVWARLIGVAVGKMHDADIVHGDLTTSNIMIRAEGCHNPEDGSPGPSVVLIDFGLGTMQSVIEDKAVDLYVLERAFLATHPGSAEIVQAVLEAYRFSCRKGTPVLQRLEQVRQRGRKREMIG